MKIVFANNYFYLRGGSERVFFGEMDLLRGRGHSVVPFSRRYGRADAEGETGRRFPADLRYEGVSLGARLHAAASLVYSFETKRKFLELLRGERPDLIHAHNIYGRLTTSILDAARRENTPAVMTLHDCKLLCPSYLMLREGRVCEACAGGRFHNCLIKKCHKESLPASLLYTVESAFNYLMRKYERIRYFICPSRFIKDKHAQYGIAGEKLVHIPNFIKTGEYRPQCAPGDYILYMGRLSREKGVMTLLKAAKKMGAPLLIAGDGPARAEYADFIRQNGMGRVRLAGYLKTDAALKSAIQNAAFLVCPSECYENAPMAVLEAMACGKPVIGADIGGIPEMVIEEETGLLFRPGSHDQLAEKIDQLLSSPSLTAAMGRRARRLAEERYSEEGHYKSLLALYRAAA
ncbi:MAG: glycosyltransferase family 4 protein [Nitrospiraceae bacterium]|nr:glycosyltransferase family 4 protein [Nitrospiraceae bacterium]